MPLLEMKRALATRLAEACAHSAVTASTVMDELTAPPTPQLGHVALPCFNLAKVLGADSAELARRLVDHASRSTGVSGTASGPYANFRWKGIDLHRAILSSLFETGERYGADDSGGGRRVLFEYCSPNIARPVMFQHLRSTLLGNILSNVHDFLGFDAVRMCFVGDWGNQFARLLAAVELWGDAAVLASGDDSRIVAHFVDLQLRFGQAIDDRPEYLERATRCLQRLEGGDPETLAQWKRLRDSGTSAMSRILARLGVRFHHIEGESAYVSSIESTLVEIRDRAKAYLSEGNWIVDVEGIPTPAVVQKKDGTTLYLTRDLSAALDRHRRFNAERMSYVVGETQRLHFELLFGVLRKMRLRWAETCEHLSFGSVRLVADKPVARDATAVPLEEVLDEARARAREALALKNPDRPPNDETAERLGIGALVFAELSSPRRRDIEVEWARAMAVDGDNGPFVFHALGLCQSLLEKAVAKSEPISLAPPGGDGEISAEEETLLLALGGLRPALHQTVRENDPYYLAHYLIDVAKTFNRFYYRFPVLQVSNAQQRQFRLNLVEGTRQVLVNGLALMGIRAPREM